MKRLKKMSFIIALFMALNLTLTACGTTTKEKASTEQRAEQKESSTKAENTSKKETITFKDQADHEVTVAVPVKKIVVMQHHSLDILGQLGAQDKVIATEKNWQKDLGDYIKDVYPNITSLPTPGDLETLNVEEIAKLKPDVVIVASQAKPDDLKKLDDLKIPYVTVSLRAGGKQKEAQNPRLANSDKAYTDGLEWSVKTLGKLTGTEERANKIWAFCLDSRKYVENQLKDVKDNERVKVFVANEDGKTYGNDKYVGAQLLRAGAINVAAKDIQGYKPYNFEKLIEWNPDYIIVQDRYPNVYKEVTTDAKWQTLNAVKNKKVLLAPFWTKPWGNPDTDSVALGEPWLAHKFYPEKVSKEYVQERANKFYKEFYNLKFKGKVE